MLDLGDGQIFFCTWFAPLIRTEKPTGSFIFCSSGKIVHAQEIENNKTIELMKKYGIDRVRGGEFCECDTKYLIRMMPQNLVDEITEVSL